MTTTIGRGYSRSSEHLWPWDCQWLARQVVVEIPEAYRRQGGGDPPAARYADASHVRIKNITRHRGSIRHNKVYDLVLRGVRALSHA